MQNGFREFETGNAQFNIGARRLTVHDQKYQEIQIDMS